MPNKLLSIGCAAAAAITVVSLAAGPAWAAVDTETAFVLNSFSFLVHGFLVRLMAAGFAMLESGLVRSKNTAAICLKNIALYSTAGLMFYLVGYSLMYTDVGNSGGWIGAFDFFYNPASAELDLINADDGAKEAAAAALLKDSGYASHVGLVLPDGLCRDGCIHRFRNVG